LTSNRVLVNLIVLCVSMFHIADYFYELPPGLIAQTPAHRRDASRLLVVKRQEGAFSEGRFFELPRFLRPGDLLVVNNTRVIPARLHGRKESGGRVELLVLDHPGSSEESGMTRICLMKSSKSPRIGSILAFGSGVSGEIREILEDGRVKIAFSGEKQLDDLLEEEGCMPLPPYIRRKAGDGHSAQDRERYQTVYSKTGGAVAAPTAGLHFTNELIGALNREGVGLTALTLHVGYGTFRPVRAADIREHRVGVEFFRIGEEAAEAISKAKDEGGRIVAVGTTVVRALETAVRADGRMRATEGKTELMIVPGFRFRAVDALITNFHLPRSSLLFLVCAFAGRQRILDAYRFAVSRKYRFYSYGDAMLIA